MARRIEDLPEPGSVFRASASHPDIDARGKLYTAWIADWDEDRGFSMLATLAPNAPERERAAAKREPGYRTRISERRHWEHHEPAEEATHGSE